MMLVWTRCSWRCPISWKGTLQQYVGRLHRLHDAKHVVRVYDYVDSQVLMLARMYAQRLNGYGAIGYRIGAAAEMSPALSILPFRIRRVYNPKQTGH